MLIELDLPSKAPFAYQTRKWPLATVRVKVVAQIPSIIRLKRTMRTFVILFVAEHVFIAHMQA